MMTRQLTVSLRLYRTGEWCVGLIETFYDCGRLVRSEGKVTSWPCDDGVQDEISRCVQKIIEAEHMRLQGESGRPWGPDSPDEPPLPL